MKSSHRSRTDASQIAHTLHLGLVSERIRRLLRRAASSRASRSRRPCRRALVRSGLLEAAPCTAPLRRHAGLMNRLVRIVAGQMRTAAVLRTHRGISAGAAHAGLDVVRVVLDPRIPRLVRVKGLHALPAGAAVRAVLEAAGRASLAAAQRRELVLPAAERVRAAAAGSAETAAASSVARWQVRRDAWCWQSQSPRPQVCVRKETAGCDEPEHDQHDDDGEEGRERHGGDAELGIRSLENVDEEGGEREEGESEVLLTGRRCGVLLRHHLYCAE
jgi:hypothetical protein